jgi:hypothetical protein
MGDWLTSKFLEFNQGESHSKLVLDIILVSTQYSFKRIKMVYDCIISNLNSLVFVDTFCSAGTHLNPSAADQLFREDPGVIKRLITFARQLQLDQHGADHTIHHHACLQVQSRFATLRGGAHLELFFQSEEVRLPIASRPAVPGLLLERGMAGPGEDPLSRGEADQKD